MRKRQNFWVYPLITIAFLMGILLIFTNSCKKDKSNPIIPVITTTAITNITQTSAVSGGNVTSDGGATVTVRGVCWSTNPNPTIADSKTSDGTGTGSFTSNISGLTVNTTYYVRSYATNSAGTGYGNELTFSTVVDIDGNVYHVITIGSQVWMLENLKVTHYRNGDLISTTIPPDKDITSETRPAYQWIDSSDAFTVEYGRLYTWFVVKDIRHVCPLGWHVPNDLDWQVLSYSLGGDSVAGGKMKETGQTHWLAPNTGATNSSGFTSVGSGVRMVAGPFNYIKRYNEMWSADSSDIIAANCAHLENNLKGLYRSGDNKMGGLSIRCILD